MAPGGNQARRSTDLANPGRSVGGAPVALTARAFGVYSPFMTSQVSTRVLITGATGGVGGEVIRALHGRDVDIVAAARAPSRAAACVEPAIHWVRFDFVDESTWRGALQGVDRLFLMRPPAISDVSGLNAFVDVARRKCVRHVVFLSVAGAAGNPLVPHHAVEAHLAGQAADYTLLRPGFFSRNLQTAYRRDIVEDDRIYVPAGLTRMVNWIDIRDIAEVAAGVLADPAPHRGMAYTLTGPGPVPWSHVVASLSSALGREIRYEPATIAGYARHLWRRGMPAGQILVQTALHVLLRFGQGERQDDTLERLLGRPARDLDVYIEDHAHLWRRAGDGRRGA